MNCTGFKQKCTMTYKDLRWSFLEWLKTDRAVPFELSVSVPRPFTYLQGIVTDTPIALFINDIEIKENLDKLNLRIGNLPYAMVTIHTKLPIVKVDYKVAK